MSQADGWAQAGAEPASAGAPTAAPRADGLDDLLSAVDDAAAVAAWGVRRDVVVTARMIAALAPVGGRAAASRWLAMHQRHRTPAEVTHRLLAWLLADARKRDGLSPVVDALLAMVADKHVAVASGVATPARAWRVERVRALALADIAVCDLDRASAELAATSAWSVEDASTVLADSLSQWFLPLNGFSATRISRNPNPKGPDADRLKAAWAAEARSQSEAVASFLDGAEAVLREHDPVLRPV